jgi:DNA-binding NarL/FixJ family response regulator
VPAVGEFEVTAFPDPIQALERIPDRPPEVLLMDIRMPQLSGIDCARLLQRRLPHLPIVRLTAYGDRRHLFAALAAGASGFREKPVSPSECAQALLEIRAGGAPLSLHAGRWLVEASRANPAAWNSTALTETERAVLVCLKQGMLVKEAAAELHVETNTVRTHLRRLYGKLEVHSKAEALAQVFPGQTP